MYRVLSDGKEVYIDERFLTDEYVRDRRDILAESWEKYKADFKPIREGKAGYKRGDELHFSSSLILPYSNFEIPVLSQFNTVGLLNEDRVGIFGYVYPTTGIYKWSPPPPGEETLSENWTVVGDSQIRVSFEESSQKRHIWNFHIKSK